MMPKTATRTTAIVMPTTTTGNDDDDFWSAGFVGSAGLTPDTKKELNWTSLTYPEGKFSKVLGVWQCHCWALQLQLPWWDGHLGLLAHTTTQHSHTSKILLCCMFRLVSGPSAPTPCLLSIASMPGTVWE